MRVSASAGVAPLGVVVDSVQTTSIIGTNTIHDLTYFFDFGDTDANVFTYGALPGTSKNKHVGGPVSCYVYETPGTYLVRMWVYDGANNKVYGPVSSSVTATDPNTVYVTTDTICFSTSGTFTGAPAGATQVTTSDASAALTTYAASNKRLLFRAGEVFTYGSNVLLNAGRTGVYFGAFGTGAKPILRSGAINLTVISGFANASLPANSARNLRVHGLRIESGGFSGVTGYQGGVQAPAGSGALDPTNYFGDSVVHDVEMDGVAMGISSSGRNTVYSKVVTTNLNNGVAVSGGASLWSPDFYQQGVIDCSFDNAAGSEHVARFQGGKILSTRGLTLKRPAATKHYLANRGDTRYETQYCVHSMIYIDGSTDTVGAVPLQIAPQNTSTAENISDVIFENSFLDAHASAPNGVLIEADDVQLRSSVIRTNLTTATNIISILSASIVGLSRPVNTRLRYLSMYSNTTAGYTAVATAAGQSGHSILGVISYAPNSLKTGRNNGTAPEFLFDVAGGTTSVASSTTANVKSLSPAWAAPAATLATYALGVGSPYIGFGVPSSVIADARGKLRSSAGATDTGAVNSAAKATDIWSLVP